MEKRIGAIILFLFAAILALALVPAVLAESNSDRGKIGDKVAATAITKARTEGKAMPAMVRMIKADENFTVRPLSHDMIERMNESLKKLKENRTRLVEEHHEKMERFDEILPRLRACNNSTRINDSTTNATSPRECAKIRTEAVERSKEAALKAADRMLNHLEKLKEKLESSENMPEDELNERIRKIDALITEVEKIKQKIQSATTKSEINKYLKELKQLVAKAKRASEHHLHGLLRAEIWGVHQRTEIMQKKLKCALDGFKANGTNTAELDQKLAELNVTMSQAKDKLKEAKDILASDNETQVAEGKELVREARDLVQKAHEQLRDIRKMVHDMGGQPCHGKQEIETELDDDDDGDNDDADDDDNDDADDDDSTPNNSTINSTNSTA